MNAMLPLPTQQKGGISQLSADDLFRIIRNELTDRYGDNWRVSVELDRALDAIDALDVATARAADDAHYDAPMIRVAYEGTGWMGYGA